MCKRFRKYLRANNITRYSFAKHHLGMKSPNPVYQWYSGKTIPTRKLQDRVCKVTNGAVRPADWLEGAVTTTREKE